MRQAKKNDSPLKLILKTVLITAACVVLLMKVVFNVSYVPTGSMLPTIQLNHICVSWRLPFLFGDPVPERGQIVEFHRDGNSELLVKRVIGLPGDVIRIEEGQIYVNGELLDEPYLLESPFEGEDTEYIVPDGMLFLLGDNRNGSLDCRVWAEHYISISNLTGKIIVIL